MKISTFGPFSMLGGFGTIAVLCVAISVFYQMDTFGFALSIAIGWFCYGKLAFAMSFTQGYGVKGTKTVAGMPMWLAAFMTMIATVIGLLLTTTYQPTGLSAGTIANLRVVGWSAAIGLATVICHWYSYGRRAYYYESEYSIRVQCAARGDSPESTDATVADFRSHGIIK